MTRGATIPDHDREAVSEALEAALYCAAFQRLEEREMKRMISELRQSGEYPEAAERVRRRLNRRRGRATLRRALPRLAQAAAVVIAVVSIGTGIALAASPAARQWAAGALVSRVTDPDGFFGEIHSRLTDGVALGGQLAVAEDGNAISVYGGTDAEPVTYTWEDAGNRAVEALASDGEGLWALYFGYEGDRQFSFDQDRAPNSCGVGRVLFGEDGSFAVKESAEWPVTAVLDPEGRPLESWGVEGCALQGGGLYFAARYNVRDAAAGFSFAPQHVRLLRWDVESGELAEIDLSGIAFDWDAELFGGERGVFLAAAVDGAAAVRVYRVEGEALALTCEIPYSGAERPHSFALRASDDALLYVLDGGVWMAPGMEPSKAVRAAVCGEVSGRGLLLDEATYAVVGGESVKVFDLSAPVGEVDALVVEGDSVNPAVNEAFLAAHPGVAVTGDSGYTLEELGSYADLLLAGKASGDVVTLDQESFDVVRDAGLIAPLTDPALVAEWETLPEGLRETLSFDGLPVALPADVFTYPDVMFMTQNWDAVRGSFGDYPATWAEYIRWLAEFSHSGAAGEYFIEFDAFERVSLGIPDQFKMYTLWTMAEAYARCWKALGEDIDFYRPEFADCVAALEDVDWSALRYGARDVDGQDRRAVCFYGDYDPYFSEEDWEAGLRTLKIRDDAPVISRASGCFAFIPAASTSKATAVEYLKTLVGWNREPGDGQLPNAVQYDFATDPEALAGLTNGACTADSIRNYRQRVGDMALRAEPDRETILATRDAVVRYVAGEDDREMLVEMLMELLG